MTQSDWIQLSIAIIAAVFASILSAVQAALMATSRARAERMVDEGVKGAERVRQLVSDPAPPINAVMFSQMGLEITSIVLVGTIFFAHLDTDWVRITVTVATMLVVSFILWGVGPRTLGRQHPVSVLSFFAPLVSLLTLVFGGVAQLMVLLGNALTPGKGFAEGPFASEAELRDLLEMAEEDDLIEADESKMIHSVFELGDTLVKELMVPRTDMVFIPEDRSLRQLLSLALRSGFSRIPVVGEGIDDVRGVVYLKDVTKRIFDYPGAERSETVGELMRPAAFVPETKPAGDLLRDMQLRHSHLVIVFDEFGGTAGLATIEDIVEEIVGEIVDEYDTDVDDVVELEPGVYRVSARLPLDELGELFDLELEDEDVETVFGLMSKLLNLVPIPGSTVVHEGIEMVADRTIGRRHQVGTVLVRRVSDSEAKEGADHD